MFDKYYQKDIEPFKKKIKEKVKQMYEDDLGSGDVTSESIIKSMKVKAFVKSKGNGILAGIFEARYLLEKLGIEIKKTIREGSKIKKGDIVMEMEGDAKTIMQAERTVVNFLGRASGIATLTNEMVEKSKNKVTATRKTNFAFSDKTALQISKGYTHRLGLFDQYLIKDNHIDIVRSELNCSRIEAIRECLKRAKKHNKDGKIIEVEVESVEEALVAAKERPDIIMFDNMEISEIKKAINQLKNSGICFEYSGGINPDNIEYLFNLVVDFDSSG
jgi:nicotinate-nucleotide pyrophosphorylase (carboxylating)